MCGIMTEKFIKRVPLKWDYKETIGYADLYELDDGSILVKGQITDKEVYDRVNTFFETDWLEFNGIISKDGNE
jgi:hypothetical protein